LFNTKLYLPLILSFVIPVSIPVSKLNPDTYVFPTVVSALLIIYFPSSIANVTLITISTLWDLYNQSNIPSVDSSCRIKLYVPAFSINKLSKEITPSTPSTFFVSRASVFISLNVLASFNVALVDELVSTTFNLNLTPFIASLVSLSFLTKENLYFCGFLTFISNCDIPLFLDVPTLTHFWISSVNEISSWLWISYT